VTEGSRQGYDGALGPIVASVFTIIGWLVFITLYALYWSKGFDLFQNIIVTVVSLAVSVLVMGVMWLIWYRPTGELRATRRDKGRRISEEAAQL
jgi:hypothetical protein